MAWHLIEEDLIEKACNSNHSSKRRENRQTDFPVVVPKPVHLDYHPPVLLVLLYLLQDVGDRAVDGEVLFKAFEEMKHLFFCESLHNVLLP